MGRTPARVLRCLPKTGFPGSQPPGCLDTNSRFGNVTNGGPVLRNAVFDGYYHYDYEYTDHHDAVPNTGSRFSSFRRVGYDSSPRVKMSGARGGGGEGMVADDAPDSMLLLPSDEGMTIPKKVRKRESELDTICQLSNELGSSLSPSLSLSLCFTYCVRACVLIATILLIDH